MSKIYLIKALDKTYFEIDFAEQGSSGCHRISCNTINISANCEECNIKKLGLAGELFEFKDIENLLFKIIK